MDLFDRNLNELHDGSDLANASNTTSDDELEASSSMQALNESATRVVSFHERIKLTKASYQFLMRMKLLGVIDALQFEEVMDELQLSGSRIITVEEVKLTLRGLLSANACEKQLKFLDFLLFQTKDELTAH